MRTAGLLIMALIAGAVLMMMFLPPIPAGPAADQAPSKPVSTYPTTLPTTR